MKTHRLTKMLVLALIAAALTADAHAMCCGGFKNPFRRRASAKVAPVDSESLFSAIETEETDFIITFVTKNKNAVDARNKDGQTPLHLAARNGLVEIVKFLLDQGAKKDARDRSMQTPLDMAHAGKRAAQRNIDMCITSAAARASDELKFGDSGAIAEASQQYGAVEAARRRVQNYDDIIVLLTDQYRDK